MAWELGKNPSGAIYEANTEVSAQFGKQMKGTSGVSAGVVGRGKLALAKFPLIIGY